MIISYQKTIEHFSISALMATFFSESEKDAQQTIYSNRFFSESKKDAQQTLSDLFLRVEQFKETPSRVAEESNTPQIRSGFLG